LAPLSGAITVSGTPGDDSLTVNLTDATSGNYVLDGAAPVEFTACTSITFNGDDGNDSFHLNQSAAILGAGCVINVNGQGNGATSGDSLTIEGGSFSTATYDYASEHSGTIQLDIDGSGGVAAATINYTGLEPITNSGTADDIIFNLPDSADDVFLEDDGIAGNNVSRLRSSNASFESTTFSNPAGSLTINAGGGDDTVTVAAPEALTGSITIEGGTGTNTASISNVTVTGNSGDGLILRNLASVVASNSSFNDNAGDGIDIATTGIVILTGVKAMGNLRGVNVSGAASFSDTDGEYSNNDDHGIRLVDIAGDVSLVRTTADNNDADDDGTGDGVNATDSAADADTVAVGGSLLIQGARFRDSGGLADHQERGVFLSGITGSIVFEDSTDPVLSVAITGNESAGVRIQSAASNATFINGTYSNNADHGIRLIDLAGTMTLVRITADNNDADDDSTGDGLSASDGGDADTFAIGGEFVVEGAAFRDTDGAGTGDHQERGVFLASIAGDITFRDSTGPVQSVTVTGNEGTGVRIADGGVNATFTNGIYSGNGAGSNFPGFNLNSFSGTVSFSSVTASGNTDNGIEVNNSGDVILTNVIAENNTTINEGDGVEIVSSASLAVIGGSFSGNVDSGLDVEFVATVSFTGVTASQNGRDGLTVDGDAVTQPAVAVVGGTFLGNVRDGIHLNTVAAVTISDGVTANSNGRYGFAASDVASLDLADLVLKSNAVAGGEIMIAHTVTLETTTSPGDVSDSVTISSTQFQHTRASDVQQAVSYAAVTTLIVNAGGGADTLDVLSTDAATIVTLHGGGGDDTVNLGDSANSLDGLAGAVTVNGDDGSGDVVHVSDVANAADRTYSVGGNSIARFGGPSINFTNIERLELVAGAGSDTIIVTPDGIVEVAVTGSDPTAPANPGDSLRVLIMGTIDPQHTTFSADAGRYTFGNRQPVTYAGIETLDGPNLRITNDDGGIGAVPGGTIVYTLNYANTGNRDAAGVLITETIPANTIFDFGASTAGWVCVPNDVADSLCTIFVGDVARGGSGSVTFAVTADNPLPLGVYVIANTSNITDDGSNGAELDPSDNFATANTLVAIDYGDAPDAVGAPPNTYPTLLIHDGARHNLGVGPRLGANADFEVDGQPDATATGDDVVGVGGDDDGVVLPAALVARLGASAIVTSSSAGMLDAWIDFNRDGDWDDAGEQIAASEPLLAGANSISFFVPDYAVAGTSFARFRVSTAGGLAPTGQAADGEVEDYSIEIVAVAESTATLIDDPLNPGQNVLVILGSGVSDKLTIKATSRGSFIDAKLGSLSLGSFVAAQVGRIVAFGLSGNDSITVSSNVAIDAQLHGDDGNDSIRGGGGHTIAIGGAHNDVLRGGRNRNLLIGGDGVDRLTGGSDILIGGTTAYDARDNALTAILSEWKSAAPYSDRVARLRAGSGVPKLNAAVVLDDLLANQLSGGRDLDWFFKGELDRVSNHSLDEFQDTL
jgi:uncharacterized repeat protein (TIGR01451 family)